MAHNETVCHATGERRMNYLNQIKCILDKLDDTPCVQDRGGNIGEEEGARPLIEYPGYINRMNPKFNKPFYVPLITNVQVKEIRPTSNLAEHIHENYRDLEYRQVDLGPNVYAGNMYNRNISKGNELRDGYIIHGCDCVKHNGLQDRCPRLECQGRPPCLTEPPSCGPANALAPNKPQRPLNELVREALESHPAPQLQYCCCTPGCGTGPSGMYSRQQMPQNFECYPCRN